jgi:hypothetical protein
MLQCPEEIVQVELIEGQSRRDEFHRDYYRLQSRLDSNNIIATFILYILEQSAYLPLEAEKLSTFPTITIYGEKNTSEIIARFVEKGWMRYYHLEHLPSLPLFFTIRESMYVFPRTVRANSYKSSFGMFIEKPPKHLSENVDRLYKELANEGRIIHPDEIRQLFAEIDRKYM